MGSYPAILKKGTIARESYGTVHIEERHRHRYEVNPEYIARLEENGLVFSGTSPDKILMEIAELPVEEHPFFLGTQFHPEFQAHPLAPHPLFNAFITASIKINDGKNKAIKKEIKNKKDSADSKKIKNANKTSKTKRKPVREKSNK